VVYCIEIELDWFLLFLRIRLVYLVLGLDYLQNRMLACSQPSQQLDIRMILALVHCLLNILQHSAEVRLLN
jgi:hypothetical protein